MSGRNVNVYLPDETYQKIKPLIEKRKVSKFVDEAIKDKLEKERQLSKEELKKQWIESYQRNAQNNKLQAEMREIEATSVKDVFASLEKKERKNDRNR